MSSEVKVDQIKVTRLLKLRLTSTNIMGSEQNKSCPLVTEPLSSSSTEGRDERGGGSSGLKTNSKPQSLDLEVAIDKPCSGSSLTMLLITANVGSIFDDPQSLIPQWMAQISQQIKEQKPGFVAIHCQEVCTYVGIS